MGPSWAEYGAQVTPFLRLYGGAFPSRRRQIAHRKYWVQELRPHRSQEHRLVRRGAPNGGQEPALQRQGRRGSDKPVADGGIVDVQLFSGGAWGQAAADCGIGVQAARCPRSFDPLLQSIPRPWGVMEYRNGIGATTPTSAAEGVVRQDRDDLALGRSPRKTEEQDRVFTGGFPALD